MKLTQFITRHERLLQLVISSSFFVVSMVLVYLFAQVLVPHTVHAFLTWRERDPEWGSQREYLIGAYMVLVVSVAALIGSIAYLVAAIGIWRRKFSILSTFAASGIMSLPLGWQYCYVNIAGFVMFFVVCHAPFYYQPTKKPVSN